MESAKKTKIFASILWLVAATVFISTHQLYTSLALGALGVFMWLSSSSFLDIPDEPKDVSGKDISPQRIKAYRQDNPDVTISQAIRDLRKA